MAESMFAKAALKYLTEGGLSLVPINAKTKRPYSQLLPQAINSEGLPLYIRWLDGGRSELTRENTGYPKGTWEPYQRMPPTEDEVRDWLARGLQSVAVVCGEVSGGVEILDFDVPGYFEAWQALLSPTCKPLPLQRTGGGGMQAAFRSEAPEHNQKLAWHLDPNETSGRVVAIETRGEAGYALLPPSLHPSGRLYELLAGRFSEIPIISLDERQHLLDCARSLCRAPQTKQEIAHPRPEHIAHEYTGESVIDAYNARHNIQDALARYGYTDAHRGRYSRPGKGDSAGVAIFSGANKSYHHSSNDLLDSDSHGLHQPRSPFDLFLMFEHDGDYRAAVKAAVAELGLTSHSQKRHQAIKDFRDSYFASLQPSV